MTRIERLALLFVALVPTASCDKDKGEPKTDSPKTAAAETAKATTDDGDADKSVASGDPLPPRIEGCWAAFGSWDKEKLRGCYAADVDVATVDGIPPSAMTTPDEVVKQAGGFRNAFADFKVDLDLVLVNGDKAVALALLSGKHKGDSLGFPPTGKPMSVLYAQVTDHDDQGRVKRQRDYVDQATILHQLGVQESEVAPPKEEPWPAPVRATARNDEGEKKNVELFKASFAARLKGDFAASSDLYADDAVLRYVPVESTYRGKAEIANAAKDEASQSAERKGDVREAWGAGNWVVARTTVRGTIAKPIAGMLKTKGKKWQENALELLEFENGKVKRHLVLANSLKFAVDIGLISPSEVGG